MWNSEIISSISLSMNNNILVSFAFCANEVTLWCSVTDKTQEQTKLDGFCLYLSSMKACVTPNGQGAHSSFNGELGGILHSKIFHLESVFGWQHDFQWVSLQQSYFINISITIIDWNFNFMSIELALGLT